MPMTESPGAAMPPPARADRAAVSIDVVVCTYNNAPVLALALQALAAQRVGADVRWRVLVVDNNCTDDTVDVVRRHAAHIPAPVTVVAEPRQGLTPARVRGVTSGDGDWIAFVDDDCLLADDWVAQAARFARDHAGCGAFGGEVALRWDAPPPAHALRHTYAFAETRLGDTAHRRDWLAGAGMVLRRSALQATGWIDRQFLDDRIGTRLVSGGDVEIGLRIASRFEVWYVPACRLQHVIPRRRTALPYLRRLVFGLGASAHDVDLLTWPRPAAAWPGHARRKLLHLTAQALRQAAGDVRHRRAGRDLRLTMSFAAGWAAAMWRTARAGAALRRARLGALAPVTATDAQSWPASGP